MEHSGSEEKIAAESTTEAALLAKYSNQTKSAKEAARYSSIHMT